VTAKRENCTASRGRMGQSQCSQLQRRKDGGGRLSEGPDARRCQLGNPDRQPPGGLQHGGSAVAWGVSRPSRNTTGQATPSDRSVWTDIKPLPKNPSRVRPSKCPLWLVEKWTRPDISNIDKGGKAPLHEAADKGHEAIVQRLLDRGANVY